MRALHTVGGCGSDADTNRRFADRPPLPPKRTGSPNPSSTGGGSVSASGSLRGIQLGAAADSERELTDESRRSTMVSVHRKRSGLGGSGSAGSAAKRAMRKRIAAARLALRKISRMSSHADATMITCASESSTTHSSPKTPASGGNK